MTGSAEVIVWQDGPLGRLRLNRPDALNALTHGMCLEIEKALISWRDDTSVTAILVDAESDRAFCAGGDIQYLYETGRKDPEPGRQFWRDEYRLNAMISNYPKPYISLMNGITMGGGVGISAHGSHRIVSDRTMVAMPETSIGFIPDVGGTWLLARAPGATGIYLGLTGARMNAADAIFAKFADTFVPAEKLPGMIEDLTNGASPEAAIAKHAAIADGGTLEGAQDQISEAFGRPDVPAVVARLEELTASGDEWASKALTMISRNAPLALVATFTVIHRARKLTSLEEALALEFNYAHRAIAGHDFLEGIRAMVVDKDRKPRWQPSRLEDVTAEMVDDMFSTLGDKEWKAA